jgi:hypothetical protein
MDRAGAERWIRAQVDPVGPIETAHERPWSTVLRVPLAERIAWFKACAPVQAFEPRLTGELFARWPDRVAEVLGRDDDRAWLLLLDAGTPMRALRNPPEVWLQVLPLYAELQRGEAGHAPDHLAHGVPDLRVPTWPSEYEAMLRDDLPLEEDEIARLRQFAPRFSQLCGELAAHQLPETIQHDDLHIANVYKMAIGCGCWIGATPPSRIRSHRWSSRSASSRRLIDSRRLTRGSPGCVTRTSSHGAVATSNRARSRSASAPSRALSPSRASGRRCRTHVAHSTRISRSCCGEPSRRSSTKNVCLAAR